ncbi:MAG: ABC transporter permease subunit, partial [Bacteroidota bacterium]
REFFLISKTAFFWFAGIFVLIYTSMIFYPQLVQEDMLQDLKGVFDNPLMGSMMEAFGFDFNQITNILAFYAMRNSSFFVMLLGSIFAIISANSLLAAEEQNKTSEFLLSRPVTRTEILFGKFLAFNAVLALFNILLCIAGYISLELFKSEPYDREAFLTLSIYTWMLHFLFGCIGIFVSVLPKRGRTMFGLSAGITLGFYFLEMISNITGSADFLGYLSPFRYADTEVLKEGYRIEPLKALFFIGIGLLFTFLTYVKYRKKDIYI